MFTGAVEVEALVDRADWDEDLATDRVSRSDWEALERLSDVDDEDSDVSDHDLDESEIHEEYTPFQL